MKLQDMCCTLPQAKHIKVLGIVQKGLFGWIIPPDNGCPVDVYARADKYRLIRGDTVMFKANGEDAWIAFTTDELGIMLLAYTGQWSTCMKVVPGRTEPVVICEVEKDGDPWSAWSNEAEGRADLLIYLLEQELISPEEVNARLTATTESK